ncbi:MAG: transcriptional regulator YeiL [Clostridiales bacterium]|nr:transcriptional regulator YeiL [Clostridiales bacterium]
MKKIVRQNLVEEYYNHFPLTDFFNFDITPYASVVQFESGEMIMQEGTAPAYLYYLINGRAKLLLSHDNGRMSLINFLNAPCFIGEMELIGAQNMSNGVTAITICTCYAININSSRNKILKDVKFLSHLCLFLGQKAIGNTYNYSRNQSYPLDVRLANFILLTAQNGHYREKHTESSEFLGVTYRHLLYVLADFVKRGILIKTNSGYYINDVTYLQKLANYETDVIKVT